MPIHITQDNDGRVVVHVHPPGVHPMSSEIRLKVSDEPALSILRDQENASRYVAELVNAAERRWRANLEHLRSVGFANNELLAVCDVLNGYAQLAEVAGSAALDSGRGIALELHDAQRLNGIAAKWGVTSERWAEIVTLVAGDAFVGRALYDLAAEFWRHSSRLERALERSS